jgi:two-component system NtrC family response regulator
MAELRLLVVEDEADQRRLLTGLLRARGYLVAAAADLAAARAALDRSPVDLVLSDWKLPDGEGLALLAEVRERFSHTAFVLVTAYGTISGAVEAIHRGADDYLPKPFEREALLLAIEKALRARRLEDENRRLTEALGERDRLVDLVGSAPSMQRLFRRVEKLATTEATVLLTGESGTGKELAARALHALSRRSDRVFVAVNCAAIPEGLMEAEFFGVERGAFTGAERTRAGNFETADSGTLFLDEIGELPLAIQAKLLRALQQKEVRPVGSASSVPVDIRVIAATNRDLALEVAEGRFRTDLFYRLNVVRIEIPPLRERREDVPLLAQHFLLKHRGAAARVEGIEPDALQLLSRYDWPGNVRELENAVESALALVSGRRLGVGDFRLGRGASSAAAPGGEVPLSLEAFERCALERALDAAGGDATEAARRLGIGRSTFYRKLARHGVAARRAALGGPGPVR